MVRGQLAQLQFWSMDQNIIPNTEEVLEILKLGLKSLCICSKVGAKREKISKVGCDMEVYGSKFIISVQR